MNVFRLCRCVCVMKVVVTVALFVIPFLGVNAQQEMRQVFKNMPDSLTPSMTKNNRLDCIDFLDSNMKAEVQNAFGGRSELLVLTDRYARLRQSDALQTELRLLDVEQPIDGSQQIVCVVQTYGTDVRESTVSFYSLSWRELSAASYLTLPTDPFCAQLDAHEDVLTLTTVSGLEPPAIEGQEILPVLSTNLKWDSNTFK